LRHNEVHLVGVKLFFDKASLTPQDHWSNEVYPTILVID